MIRAQHLTMNYGPVRAVDDASFEVNRKEVVGMLGPNGAGKSTIMKILTTYLWPTSGTAQVCGFDVLENPLEVRKRIGYLPEVPPLYMDMEVGKYLEFVGMARGLSGDELSRRLDWAAERCGVKPVFRTLIRELSKGYRQRTALAQALIHDPEVVILDEPTSGLDPHQILEIRKLVRELAEEKAVIFSTHILQEVEAVADRIIILHRGRIVADGPLDELRKKAAGRSCVEVAAAASREEVRSALSSIPSVENMEEVSSGEDGTARFRVFAKWDADLKKAVGDALADKGLRIRELAERLPSLEETFLALTAPPTGMKGKERTTSEEAA